MWPSADATGPPPLGDVRVLDLSRLVAGNILTHLLADFGAEVAPSAAELAQAKRIVAAAQEAARQGIGAFDLDGRMIDEPVVLRARRLCERAERTIRPGEGRIAGREPW